MKKKLIALLLCIQAALLGGCGDKNQAEPDSANGKTDSAVESSENSEGEDAQEEDSQEEEDQDSTAEADMQEEEIDEILDMAELQGHYTATDVDLASQSEQTYDLETVELNDGEYLIYDVGELKADEQLSASLNIDSKATEDDRITVGILKGYHMDDLNQDEEYLLDDAFQQSIDEAMSFDYVIPEDDTYLLCITSNSESTLTIKNGKLYIQ